MHNQRSASQPLSLMDMAEQILRDDQPVRWRKRGVEYVGHHKHVSLHVGYCADAKGQPWAWVVKNDHIIYGAARARTKSEAQANAEKYARSQL